MLFKMPITRSCNGPPWHLAVGPGALARQTCGFELGVLPQLRPLARMHGNCSSVLVCGAASSMIVRAHKHSAMDLIRQLRSRERGGLNVLRSPFFRWLPPRAMEYKARQRDRRGDCLVDIWRASTTGHCHTPP